MWHLKSVLNSLNIQQQTKPAKNWNNPAPISSPNTTSSRTDKLLEKSRQMLKKTNRLKINRNS